MRSDRTVLLLPVKSTAKHVPDHQRLREVEIAEPLGFHGAAGDGQRVDSGDQPKAYVTDSVDPHGPGVCIRCGCMKKLCGEVVGVVEADRYSLSYWPAANVRERHQEKR